MTSFINDPEHWRVRAEEIRALADEEQDDVSKQMMLRIAADLSKVHFELLAREGELRNSPERCRPRAACDGLQGR